MAAQLFTNNASAALASSITSSSTTLTVTTGTGDLFPTLAGGNYFLATLTDASNNIEIVKVTARVADVFTVVRAQEGTTAYAYSAADKIELRITAGMLNNLIQLSGTQTISGDKTFSGANTFSGTNTFSVSPTVPTAPVGDASGAAASTLYVQQNSGQGATGGGTDKLFILCDLAATTDYTIPSDRNAGTFGPIAINAGVVVTVPDDSTWTVV